MNAAMSGFSGRGCCGGGAGGCENGDIGSTFADGKIPFVCSSPASLCSGGGFGNSCPGSRLSSVLKNLPVCCRS